MTLKKYRVFKDKKLLFRHCRVPGCPASFRPVPRSTHDLIGLCWPHRRLWRHHKYITWFLPWLAKLTPEELQQYRQMKYTSWLKWMNKSLENLIRRRAIELASYHKQKAKRQEKRNAKRREYYARTKR